MAAAVMSSTLEHGETDDLGLELHDIQGDIVVGLQKNWENFVFFRIDDPRRFKRALIERVIARVTNAEVAYLREWQLHVRKQSGSKVLLPFDGLNVCFSFTGLGVLLGFEPPGLDPSFEAGAADRAQAIGDPVDSDGQPSNWKEAFKSERIDGVFLLTGPDELMVEERTTNLIQALGDAVTVIYAEYGHVRPDRGHEHFGFLDGISRPGIRGLTERHNPRDRNQGLPGQDLLWPGQFLFGYPRQDPEGSDRAGEQLVSPVPWLRNSSYMVFRRLEQRVPEFRSFVAAEASRLELDPELLAARLVGRWRSGAPLIFAPLQDDSVLGQDRTRNNDFSYAGDPAQRRCPFAAHIRKANPRDDLSVDSARILARQFIRAGIPFGPEVGPGEERQSKQERGLMFVCYQSSIVDQFEFVQSEWSNRDTFPFGKLRPDGSIVRPGIGPVIGQSNSRSSRIRVVDEPIPNYPFGNVRSEIKMPSDFVVSTAAGYFLAPSISALRLLSTEKISLGVND